MSPAPTTTVVSAPGKVLIAGGYLVLDPKYRGTVLSTSSRFYTVIQYGHSPHRIRVRSPQFVDAVWDYEVRTTAGSLDVEDSGTNKSKNKFVHLALASTITLAAEITGIDSVREKLSKGTVITVIGDNDFYSQREKLASLNLPRTIASLSKVSPFASTGVPLSDVHKTGLGSSAALITSLVSAFLLHLGAILPSSFDYEQPSEGRLLAHNLAQYVHCLAQGKIGSGFDVAAAVFGTHLYTRFSPMVLEGLMNDDVPLKSLSSVLAPSNTRWDYKTTPFKLPPFTKIMLADVNAGSDTPSLVSTVLKWRSENPTEALALWTSLDVLNQKLSDLLTDLSLLYEKSTEEYTYSVKYAATLPGVQWSVSTPLLEDQEKVILGKLSDVQQVSETIRDRMRELSRLAGVPIEPPEQTKLLDACLMLAGVIAGGVPGAGGYDAIWLLVCDPVDFAPDIPPSSRVERVWSTYTDLDVSPLSAFASTDGGARVEDLEKVTGLKDALAL